MPITFHGSIKSLFLIMLLLLSGSCTSTGLFLANTIAMRADLVVVENVHYGNLAEQRLDIYTPVADQADQNEGRPVVVFFYGGCWGACNTYTKEKYAFAAEALTTNNFIAVLPDYRHYPDVLFPEIISDATLAVNWVRDNIAEYGGNRDTIFLMGHSAGAHLAAMLTMNEHYLRGDTHHSIRGFVGLAGPYDFLPLDQAYQRTLFGPRENYPDSQPIKFVDGSEPPFLLLYGDKDKVVKSRNIENLAVKATGLGVDVTSIRYPDINHAALVAALSKALRNRRPVADDVMNFLKKHAGDDSNPAPEQTHVSD